MEKRKSLIPNKIEAPFLDKVQFMTSRVFVLQIHLNFFFKERLETERLKRALRLALDREPVLGCSFVPASPRPFWKRLPEDFLDSQILLEEVNGDPDILEKALADFLAEPHESINGPQMKALLLHEEMGDRLIMKVNHQVVDAAGTKELGYLVADIYKKLGENPDYHPLPNTGSRDLAQVFSRFNYARLLKIFFGFFSENLSFNYPPENMIFPAKRDFSGELRFSFLRFNRERVEVFKEYCKKHKATLNDLFVAGLFRAVARKTGWKGKETLRLICTVDLRRYLPEEKSGAICNLSGFFVPNLGKELGANLEETLLRTKSFIDREKKKNIGLSLVFVDSIAGFMVPFKAFRVGMEFVVNKMAKSAKLAPALTNLGRLRKEFLDFGGFFPEEAEALVPPTRAPFFALGLSGYDDTLTVSVGYYPEAVNPGDVAELFDLLENVLPG